MLAEYGTPRNGSAQERVLLRGQWCLGHSAAEETVESRSLWCSRRRWCPGVSGAQETVESRRHIAPRAGVSRRLWCT